MSRPLYIFDLDGTLALIQHRRHFVEGENKDWAAFFKACISDAPNWPVIRTAQQHVIAGGDVWIWSGRSTEVDIETMQWLGMYEVPFATIRMRLAGDHQPDEKLKAAWLAEMHPFDRARLVAIYEDRDRMVKLWRDNGIACFQVAPGNF